jgi:cell division septation protein DedD
MVANGDAANGRKLVDSVAAGAPVGSAAYAEGLFWRATVAANARDSEHEYRQIIVDYPLSGRVPDALLRIGQLESARGETAAALQHFQRLVLEHPSSPLRADANYWVARMYFEANDTARGCTANADALASVRTSNVELKNRIDFQQQRCRGVTLAANTPMTTPAAVPAAVPAAAPAKTATPKAAKVSGSGSSVVSPKVTSPAPEAEPAETVAAISAKPSTGSWAVQVAAFSIRAPATQFAAKLKGRGYDAYIDGTSAPYRARIGHYPTHASAAAALAKLKAKHIDGFIVER